nr:LuxR family transcriptional regulator [Tritonibacter litoralis]
MDFADAQNSLTAPEAAFTLLDTELKTFGAKSAVYGMLPAPSVPGAEQVSNTLNQAHTFFSYPEEYAGHYMVDELIGDDPFARFCATTEGGAMGWHDPRAAAFATQRSKQVLSLAADFGLQYGMSVPLRDGSGQAVGGIGVALDLNSTREADDTLRAYGHDIEMAALLFHARFHDELSPKDVISLSSREIECLKWAAAGLLTKEIAFRLSLSDKTVEFHLRNATKRLNARNRTHAVARALVYGLLTL